MPTHTQSEPTTRPLSTIPPKPVQWLWHPRIPRGKITLLAADPGSGKTTLALSLAAHLSRGESPPHSSPQPHSEFTDSLILNSPLATLLLSPEDNPADTLIPKLQALNANLHHIHLLENLHSLIPSQSSALCPQSSPLSLLESAIQSIPNLALLIIDPITHYLGLTDKTLHPSDPTQLRSTLHALSHLAEKYNLALLLTTRLTKSLPNQTKAHASDSWTPSLHRTLGSLAFASTARSVLLITPIPPAPQSPPSATARANVPSQTELSSQSKIENQNSKIPAPTHLLLSLKSNLTKTPPILAFTLTQTIHWHETTYSLPLTDSKKPKPKTSDPKDDSLLAESIDFLNTLLAEGPSQARHILTSATHNGINHRTLRRAKSHLHIHCQWSPPWKAWFWSLPGDKRPLPKTDEQREQEKNKKILAASSISDVIALMEEWDKEL